MTALSYREVTPKRRSLGGFSQAWLGPDHLLVVHSLRVLERYQRFALADIQSISIGDGPRRAGWQTAAVATSFLWMMFVFSVTSPIGKGFFIVTGGTALALAIRDIARGQRCTCILQTAVSRQRLLAVSRKPVAQRFLAVITPAIQEAQANMIGAQDPTDPPPLPYELPHGIYGKLPPLSPALPPALTRKRSYVAEALFILLVLDAGIVWAALASPASTTIGLLPTVYLAEVVLAGVALAQRNSRLEGLGFGLMIASLVFTLVDVFAVSGVAGWLTLMNSARSGSNRGALNSVWLSPSGTLLFSTLWRAMAGVLGLTLSWLDRRTPRA